MEPAEEKNRCIIPRGAAQRRRDGTPCAATYGERRRRLQMSIKSQHAKRSLYTSPRQHEEQNDPPTERKQQNVFGASRYAASPHSNPSTTRGRTRAVRAERMRMRDASFIAEVRIRAAQCAACAARKAAPFIDVKPDARCAMSAQQKRENIVRRCAARARQRWRRLLIVPPAPRRMLMRAIFFERAASCKIVIFRCCDMPRR